MATTRTAWGSIPDTETPIFNPTLFPPMGTQLEDLPVHHFDSMISGLETHSEPPKPHNFFTRLPVEVLSKILRLLNVRSLHHFIKALPDVRPLVNATITSLISFAKDYHKQPALLKSLMETLSRQSDAAVHSHTGYVKRTPSLVCLYETEDYALRCFDTAFAEKNTLRDQFQSNSTVEALLQRFQATTAVLVMGCHPGYRRSLKITLTLKGCTVVENTKGVLLNDITDQGVLDNPLVLTEQLREPFHRYFHYRSIHQCDAALPTLSADVLREGLHASLLSMELTECPPKVQGLQLPFAIQLSLSFPNTESSPRPTISNLLAPRLERFEVSYYEKPPVFDNVQVGDSTGLSESERRRRALRHLSAALKYEFTQFKLVDEATVGITTLSSRCSTLDNALTKDTNLRFTKNFQVIEISGGPTDELLSRISVADNTKHLIIREYRYFDCVMHTPALELPELTDLDFDTVIPGRSAPCFKTPKLKNLYLRSTAPGFDPEPALDAAPSDLDRLYVGVITRTRGGYEAYEFKRKHVEKFAEKIVWLSLQGVTCPSLDLPSNTIKMPELRFAVFDPLPTEDQRSSGKRDLRIRLLRFSPVLTRLIISQNTTGPRPWWHSLEVPHVHSRGVYVHGFPDDAISLDGQDQLGLIKLREAARAEPVSIFHKNLYFRTAYTGRFLPSTHTKIPSDWEFG